ncbi:hypothetical protein NDU88_008071 [Pleurodeles waltl]|uniref:Uncharacterized protein n=1 Tax=Pleurodeles waltl TaxID=8319 RepID=A0AAV7VRI2_PLEWA|nr:hypothetical protein NDU88_008071 [Pleurodeles waltl]
MCLPDRTVKKDRQKHGLRQCCRSEHWSVGLTVVRRRDAENKLYFPLNFAKNRVQGVIIVQQLVSLTKYRNQDVFID